jgi:hypothetical protein
MINGHHDVEYNDIVSLDSTRKLPRGFVNIPVCSWREAATNFYDWKGPKYGDPYKKWPNFPCSG